MINYPETCSCKESKEYELIHKLQLIERYTAGIHSMIPTQYGLSILKIQTQIQDLIEWIKNE